MNFVDSPSVEELLDAHISEDYSRILRRERFEPSDSSLKWKVICDFHYLTSEEYPGLFIIPKRTKFFDLFKNIEAEIPSLSFSQIVDSVDRSSKHLTEDEFMTHLLFHFTKERPEIIGLKEET